MRDGTADVFEGGLEHAFRCDLPGSGKSCNKSNTIVARVPVYSVECSLFMVLPGLFINQRRQLRANEPLSGDLGVCAAGRD